MYLELLGDYSTMNQGRDVYPKQIKCEEIIVPDMENTVRLPATTT
jgi:hypothetical protein